jgi:DNA-binding CsgD family transcriptional regulator/PAS domain-containing protein
MISTRAFSELLATLYAAPLDEPQWQVFLTQLCEITSSRIGFFLRNDSTLGNRTLASGGMPVPAQVQQSFKAAHNYSDPFRQALLRNPRIGVIEGEELFPHHEFVETELYRDLASGGGTKYATCLVLSLSTRTFEIISLWRGPERAFLEDEHKELLGLLMPHLQNALRIRHALGLCENRARNAEAMLNASATASVLLDGTGRVIHMNESARNIAVANDGFTVRVDRIVPTDHSRRSEFLNLVTACTAADMGHTGGALALGRAFGKRPLQLLITPVRLMDKYRASVRVLILATDPELTIHFPDAILRHTYGLTPAETEIANALLTGFSLEEIAQLRKVSIATVRSQMKGLMGKTDTQRQGDLIRLLSTLPRTAPNAVGTHPQFSN